MAALKPLKLIKFSEAHNREGFATIFRAGTVVWTKERGSYLVDEKGIEALQKKGVPFIDLNSEKNFGSPREITKGRETRSIASKSISRGEKG